ncbi:MAG: UTP--glucose-1-phosphate uridylyltransferase [Microgenomates group bacterium]
MKITKAIIAAAGYGTRFLPATKVQPKEMLPLLDKPIIQYLVEELVASGIKEIIIVTRAGQHILEDHFDSSPALENMLEINGKTEYLKMVRQIPRLANFVYLRQTKDYPYGNGTPLLVAAPLLSKNEAFVYLFGDDVVKSKIPATKQLIDIWEKFKPAAVLGVQKVPWGEIHKYASIKYKKKSKLPWQAAAILEKLPADKAPSNMAQFGRFVLTWKVIEVLKKQKLGKGGELWLADALNTLAKKEVVVAQPIKGTWLTTGDPLSWVKTNIEFALEKKEIREELLDFLKEKLAAEIGNNRKNQRKKEA